MQIVIDIPEEQYITLNAKSQEEVLTVIDISLLIKAIKDGTQLPKGHGRLIDTNEITAFMELECNGHNVESLDEFTVIIEADGGDAE